jgi:hypothetical protein
MIATNLPLTRRPARCQWFYRDELVDQNDHNGENRAPSAPVSVPTDSEDDRLMTWSIAAPVTVTCLSDGHGPGPHGPVTRTGTPGPWPA